MKRFSEHVFGLAEILVLAGTTGAGIMAAQASTRISARLKRVGNTIHPRTYDCHSGFSGIGEWYEGHEWQFGADATASA